MFDEIFERVVARLRRLQLQMRFRHRAQGCDQHRPSRAFRPASGEIQWEYKIFSAPSAGVLSTEGGLLFAGTNEGDFLALDAATGKSLWRFQAGAAVQSNPMSYLSEGKQHVAIAAGNALFAFAME